ncbi:amidohydrolase family protein [Mycolicibacterium mucogenicum]|uniref:amidohydrolase family protein n=1 Tax=Mycolicibacterium mucogenicum TaxID=56689 RepID=UPI000A53CBC5|nr:amidohydrolase family protein [Mycolicibacterium mucogenicum]KAB7756907.1 amidohydrolase [Mycolicibacterium mucogenicum DSM 44124]
MSSLTLPRRTDQQVRLVTDVTVWTGRTWRAHADVVIADGAVAAVRDHARSPWAPGTVDGAGAHLIPGFVNTHTHLQQSLCRGVGEGQPLLQWLLAVGEAMNAITPERAYLATVAAALEGLLSGTTTLVEHMWPHPSSEVHDAVLAGLADVGVRAVLGRGIADRADPTRKWGFDPRLMQPLDSALNDVDRLAAAAGDRVQLALAVPNPRSLTIEGMRSAAAFAADRALTTMIHLSETGTDDARCREHAGMSAVDYLAEGGLIGERLLAVHGVELDEYARRILAAGGAAVSWNPVSNMRLGSGVAPVTELLAEGVAVGIGVDGAGSNDRQDMLETLRAGAYVQRAHARRADLFDTATMLSIACDGAARALGGPVAEVPGGVTVGRPADLTLLRFDRDFACLPVTDPGATLLTCGTPRIVDTVLVGGEAVVAGGSSTRIDVDALTAALLTSVPVGV